MVFRLFNYGLALVLLLLYDCRRFVVGGYYSYVIVLILGFVALECLDVFILCVVSVAYWWFWVL